MGNPTRRKGAGDWSTGKPRGPRKMLTPDEFEQKASEYFKDCKVNDDYPTVSGLAYALGFKSVQSVFDYREDDDYDYAISRAYLFIESWVEQKLLKGETPPAAGIFTLKARFGLVDKQELNHTSSDGSMSPTAIQLLGPDDDS